MWVIEGAGLSETILAKFVGVTHSIGNSISYHLLKETGRIITRSTVQPVTLVERKNDFFVKKTLHYFLMEKDVLFSDNRLITNKNSSLPIVPIEQNQDYILDYHNHVLNNSISPVEDKVMCTPDTVGDLYLKSELAIPRVGFDSP